MTELYQGKPCKRGHDGIRYATTKGCVECQKLLRLDYDTKNREKRLTQRKAWQQDNLESVRNWREENADRIKRMNKEWAQNNRGVVNSYSAKRRAARLNATPPWITPEQLTEMKLFYKNCPEGFEVDHIVPLQGELVCGLHVPGNLQYLPKLENRKKSNKFILP